MKRTIVIILFLLLFPLLLLAAEVQPTWGDIFVKIFNDWIVPTVGTALGLIILYLVKLIASKFGVTLSKEQEDWVAKNAQRLVLAAEEVSRTNIKNKGDSIKGQDKLKQVVGVLITKFPKLSEEEATRYVNEAVAKIPGIGNFTAT